MRLFYVVTFELLAMVLQMRMMNNSPLWFPVSVRMLLSVVGISCGAFTWAGCRDGEVVDHADIRVSKEEEGWTYRVSDARTVSELREDGGVLTRAIALRGPVQGRYYHHPSCYCLGITRPTLDGDGETIEFSHSGSNQSMVAQMQLPLVPKAGRHSISLVPVSVEFSNDRAQGHTLIWDFNIVEDLTIEPRILSWTLDGVAEAKLIYRSNERDKVELRKPILQGADSRIRLTECRRVGTPFQPVGACWAQEWFCRFRLTNLAAEQDSPTAIKMQMIGGQDGKDVESTILIDVQSARIKHPRIVDLGEIAAHEVHTRQFRVGDPYDGPSFAMKNIRCTTPEMTVTVHDMAPRRSHWMTVTMVPRSVGPFESAIEMHVEGRGIFTIRVVGEVR